MSAFAGVFDPIVVAFAAHFRVEIGEMEPGAGDADGDCVGCVEAEEPDAGFAAVSYVGADVELRECGESWQRGRGAETYAGHAKGDDADPGFVLECIDT